MACELLGEFLEVPPVVPVNANHLDPIFKTIAPGRGDLPRTPGREKLGGTAEEGYLHCGPAGAGHFVKMVHNGVEYGMMAALAEGFDILKNADADIQPVSHDAETAPRMGNDLDYKLPLGEIAELWRRGSVVQSWLLDLIAISANLLGATGFGLLTSGGDYRFALMVAGGIAFLGAMTMALGNLDRLGRLQPVAA